MKKIIFPIAIVATLMLSAFTTIKSTAWKINDGYAIKFTSENPTGIFRTMTGDIQFDENDLGASSFNMTVDVASINTGNGMQNKHAKSAKWFDAEQYPKITFRSTKIEKTANGYQTVGLLNLHGIEKEISIPFTFSDDTFIGSFEVDRLDYKIGDMKGMNANASQKLRVDISVPVSK